MAASSQTLVMVDGGWGGLLDPNIIWIGHHLVLRAGGLSECSDARSTPIERCACGMVVSHFQRERAITMRSNSMAARPTCPSVRPLSLSAWSWPVLAGNVTQMNTRDSQARRPTTTIRARGETESSETQVMTYPYCVGILKHSPPTIYHGQGLASGTHTGSY